MKPNMRAVGFTHPTAKMSVSGMNLSESGMFTREHGRPGGNALHPGWSREDRNP